MIYKIKFMLRKKIKFLLIKFCNKYYPELLSRKEQYLIVIPSLEYSKNPIILLNYYTEILELSKKELWKAINYLQEISSPAYVFLVDNVDSIESQDLYLKIKIKDIIRKNDVDCSGDIDAIIEKLTNESATFEDFTSVKGILTTAVLMKYSISGVLKKLSSIGVTVNSLTDHQKVKLLSRYVYDADGFKTIRSSLGTVKEPAELKIIQMELMFFGGSTLKVLELKNKFNDLPFNVSKTYFKEINPIHESIPDSNNFLYASYDESSKNKLIKIIFEKIQNKKSLSYIRLGDGEAYGFTDVDLVDSDGKLRQEMHWWGEELEGSLRERLNLIFRDALNRANIIGVPTFNRLIKDFNLEKKDDYPCNSLISRVLSVMRCSIPYLDGKLVVEDQSNIYLFDNDFVNEIFTHADKVCVVSGIDSSLIRNWAPDNDKLTCIELPTHRLLRNDNVGSSVGGILPHVYEEYLENISTHAGPGVVFLVSAGFIGKIFIDRAAREGAVALDIGQALVSSVRAKERIS